MSVLGLPRPAWMTDELDLLADATRRFLETEALPNYERWEKQQQIDRAFWKKAGDQGLLGAEVPEEFGGPGGSFAHDAVITRQSGLAGTDGWGGPLHNAIVIPYILHYGTREQKERLLPRLVAGDLVGAIAMTEPGAGSDVQSIRTRAEKAGNSYAISGSKTFITNGHTADLILLAAKTDQSLGAKGVSLFLVETQGLEGFRRGRNLDKIGLKANDTAELFFDNAKVPADALLGEAEGQGFSQLMQQLPQERLLIAIQATSRIERALKVTLDYVKERKAFGHPIAEFQNTQFELAECKTEATVAQVFVDHCIERHLRGELDTATASMAKYWTTDLQCKIIDRCLQLHGGYGYMNEYPIAKMYRDARVERIYGGTNEIMKVLIARTL
ncbi:MAG: acyl-CoA dehydrogenase family protein [Hyphomicrobiales bacterium]